MGSIIGEFKGKGENISPTDKFMLIQASSEAKGMASLEFRFTHSDDDEAPLVEDIAMFFAFPYNRQLPIASLVPSQPPTTAIALKYLVQEVGRGGGIC